jgi:putative SOS response-associated peptidase YedK
VWTLRTPVRQAIHCGTLPVRRPWRGAARGCARLEHHSRFHAAGDPAGKDSGERELAFLKWRLVPFWSKTPKPPFESINARADKLLTSSAWREPFQRRRCLIPGEFFYEWEQVDKKTKQPYAVALTDDRLFSFGGIWDRWKDHNTGQIIESFAMITCDPNETMEAFHDRTPLVIESRDYDRWLAVAEPSQLPIDLVRTYPAEGMKAWKIAKLSGNGPHLLDPLPEAPPPSLMLF